jgi:hypothetical protein
MTAQPIKTIILDLLQQGHRDQAALVQTLNEIERTVPGTWERWSAKDHLAHRTFWHQDLVHKVAAILQDRELPASEADEEQLNAMVFEQHRLRPFVDVHAESERAYTELITLVQQLSEADLTTSTRFAVMTGEQSLYTAFLGGCYEHDQEHLAQYALDHHGLARAIEIREQCASRIVQAELPAWVKGWFLYNLACFYAQQQELNKAAALVQEACTLAPDLKARSQSDPDLAAVRDQLV